MTDPVNLGQDLEMNEGAADEQAKQAQRQVGDAAGETARSASMRDCARSATNPTTASPPNASDAAAAMRRQKAAMQEVSDKEWYDNQLFESLTKKWSR